MEETPISNDDTKELCQNICSSIDMIDPSLAQASLDALQRELLLLEMERKKEETAKLKLQNQVLLLQQQLLHKQLGEADDHDHN